MFFNNWQKRKSCHGFFGWCTWVWAVVEIREGCWWFPRDLMIRCLGLVFFGKRECLTFCWLMDRAYGSAKENKSLCYVINDNDDKLRVGDYNKWSYDNGKIGETNEDISCNSLLLNSDKTTSSRVLYSIPQRNSILVMNTDFCNFWFMIWLKNLLVCHCRVL